MNRSQPSIDGFIPRRPSSADQSAAGATGLARPGQTGHGLRRPTPGPNRRQFQPAAPLQPEAHHGMTRHESPHGLRRQEVADALADIDSTHKEESKGARRPAKQRPRLSKKQLKRIVLVILAILVAIMLYVGIRALIAGGSIFRGDLLGLVQSAPLKTDANGRSNVLVFGTSEDNYEGGKQHDGAYLTDSIMLVSIDQEKNNAYMVSIPRDLWVRFGAACNAGYEGRINEYYACYSRSGADEEAGADAFRQKIGEVTGLDVQYYAHLNYTVVEQAVDAVGGISVDIDSPDPRGIYDPNFDWRCNYECNLVKYPNGPTGNIDGERALALARARNAQGGYGLQRGNFDREQYQQKIMRALAEKAVSAGTVTNVGKVTNLMDALGDNLRTNFQTKEIRTLMRLAKDIPQEDMVSIDLATEGELAVEVTSISGISVVQPVSGLHDYTSIKTYIRQQIASSDPVVREAARIGVYNGSSTPGVARTVADSLGEANLNIVDVGNAPEGGYNDYEIYDLTQSKPSTKSQLESRFGVSAKSTPPPLSIPNMDFVIIVGRALNS